MKKIRRLVLAAMLSGLTVMALHRGHPQTARAGSLLPATVSGAHEFDFNFGLWKTQISRLLHPLSGSKAWARYTGTVRVRDVWNGRASIEEVEARGKAGRIEIVELRLYNPDSREWTINSANDGDGVIEPPPMTGRFTGSRGAFYDQELYAGHPVFVRQIWSIFTPRSYSMVQSFSADGGATWEPNFIAHVTRAD